MDGTSFYPTTEVMSNFSLGTASNYYSAVYANNYYGANVIGNNGDPLIRSSTQAYLEAGDDPIVNIALNKKGQVGFELTGVKTARLNFTTAAGDPVFTFPSSSGTVALNENIATINGHSLIGTGDIPVSWLGLEIVDCR